MMRFFAVVKQYCLSHALVLCVKRMKAKIIFYMLNQGWCESAEGCHLWKHWDLYHSVDGDIFT
jgi:hypothetical protein